MAMWLQQRPWWSHRDLQSEDGKRSEPLEPSGLWFSPLSHGCVADLAFVMKILKMRLQGPVHRRATIKASLGKMWEFSPCPLGAHVYIPLIGLSVHHRRIAGDYHFSRNFLILTPSPAGRITISSFVYSHYYILTTILALITLNVAVA